MKKIKGVLNSIIRFCVEWPGIYSIFFALFAFIGYGFVIKYFDEYAGTYDIGSLQAFFLAFLGLVFANDAVIFGTKMNFPKAYDAYKQFIFEECDMSQKERLKIFMAVAAFYFGAYLFLLYICTSLTKTVYIPMQ